MIQPDEQGTDSLARQIKMTGRAYPVFDIAQMILGKPERHRFKFDVVKKPDGTPVQPLFVCVLDDSLWLSEAEAVAHVLDRQFATFYQTERIKGDAPKGVYTFVAQCGMSGAVLGPPNYHGYQDNLRKLHAERFSRMPFDMYKARVKIVRDEEIVKKWIEDQSWRTEYVCLNVPEAARLLTRDAVEKHFRETHLGNVIHTVEHHVLTGPQARGLRSQGLARVVRMTWEEQRRFPLKLVMHLSQMFASRGLQFFKRDKTVTHVAVARPTYLDLDAAPVSDGIRRIIEHIQKHPGCSRVQLIEALAPSPKVEAPAPAPAPAPLVEGATAPAPAPAPAPVRSEATPEQQAVITDIHWLLHQGNVLEFANGIMETAKKPVPRPPKPEPKPGAKPAPATPEPAATEASAAPTEAAMAAEVEAIAAADPAPEDSGEAAPAGEPANPAQA